MDHPKIPGSTAAYRRQKQIEDCLYDNLLQRPYQSVSVSDLCLQLSISRKSFYNYFPDKDSCFRSIVSRTLHSCILYLTSDVAEHAPQEDIIAAYLSFWREQKDLLDIITRNNLTNLTMDQCIHFLQVENQILLPFLNTPQLNTDNFVLACFVSTQITLILQWYFQDFKTPLADMIHTYKRLIYQPLLRLS